MVLTGPEAYKRLKAAHEIIKKISESVIVDCDDDYLLLIASRAALITAESAEIRDNYDYVRALHNSTEGKGNAEVFPSVAHPR